MWDTPCAARGAEPLAFCSWRWGVAGRADLPAEVGGGGPKGRRQGGDSFLTTGKTSPLTHTLISAIIVG
jgi:hypothetical protein